MFVNFDSSNLRLDEIIIDLTSNYKVTVNQTGYRPKRFSSLVLQDDEYDSQIIKWVNDIKNFFIIEYNLLPYTKSYFKDKNLRIDSIILGGFSKDTDGVHIYGTVNGHATHNELPMPTVGLLPFQIRRTLSKNGVFLITSFIENNIGEIKWQ